MPIRRIPIHPATGKNPPSGGARSRQFNGSNTSFGYQAFVEAVDSISHFHGAVLPDDMLVTGTLRVRATFRQLANGTEGVAFDCGLLDIAKGTDRDAVLPPASVTGVLVKTLAGLAGNEFDLLWDFQSDTFAGGRELLFWIRRLGNTNASDIFAGEIALVSLELQIPLPDQPVDPELLALEKEANCLLKQILDKQTQLGTIMDYWSN